MQAGVVLRTLKVPRSRPSRELTLHDHPFALYKGCALAIDVHIVQSTEAPTACGEPPVPVISPVVVNALFGLTGKRYRTLHWLPVTVRRILERGETKIPIELPAPVAAYLAAENRQDLDALAPALSITPPP